MPEDPVAATPDTPSAWVLRRSAGYRFASVLLSLAVATIVALVHHEQEVDQAEAALVAEAARLERQLDRMVDLGMVSGALRLMGTVDETLKNRLRSAPLANGGRSLMLASRALAMGVDGLMLADNMGRVIERWDPDHERHVVPSWRMQAGASVASGGQHIPILAVADTAALDHAVLLVGPVWKMQIAQPADPDAVLGHLVARLDPGTLRSHLSTARTHTVLIAPLGRTIAASTHPGALLEPLRQEAATLQTGRSNLDVRYLLPVAQRLVVRRELTWPLPPSDAGAAAAHSWSVLVARDVPGKLIRDFPAVAWLSGALTLLACLALLHTLRAREAQLRERAANDALAAENREQTAWRARLGEAILSFQEAQQVPDLGHHFFRFLHDTLGMVQGVLYEHRGDHLELSAQWGCDGEPEPRFALGEGLLGQAAIDREALLVQSHSDGWDAIPSLPNRQGPAKRAQSALGEWWLGSRLIIPIVHHGQCLAVVDLGWLSPIHDRERDRAQSLSDLLGVNLKLLQARR